MLQNITVILLKFAKYVFNNGFFRIQILHVRQEHTPEQTETRNERHTMFLGDQFEVYHSNSRHDCQSNLEIDENDKY